MEYHQAISCCLPLASGQWCRMMMSKWYSTGSPQSKDNDSLTVWDRVPKEDAANFESDTFL